MKKETVFFSHSSSDCGPLNILKDLVKSKTGSMFEIFLSSDGQSIPFGSNWVHKIEQGLANAVIMFIFVTPNSLKSDWIYFESGYTYAKGIKVIPVGVGVDIASIKPPLNLLQGFNVSSCDGLNNILKIINDEFNTTFPESFTEKEFRMFSEHLCLNTEEFAFNAVVDHIESAITSYTRSEDNIKVEIDSIEVFDKCKEIVAANFNDYSFNQNTLLSSGIRIKLFSSDSREGEKVSVAINSQDLSNNFSILKDIVKQSYKEKEVHYFTVVLNPEYDVVVEELKVSSLISKCKNISFGGLSTASYKYKDIRYTLFESSVYNSRAQMKKVLNIVFKQDTSLDLIYELINMLLNIGIIFRK